MNLFMAGFCANGVLLTLLAGNWLWFFVLLICVFGSLWFAERD